ncbi:MAG: FAD-binding oxidoreductase [Burkholderiales bacterium]|nr:FAD-binding oxidoreductase [Burkholderiales bacterium]
MSLLLDTLRAQFGSAQVLTGPDAAPFERDWRGQFPGQARAVLLPRSREEVQAMLRRTAEFGVDIVPQGGNTGLVGGSTPNDSGRELVLSLKRMNVIHRVNTGDLSVHAEAGCVLAMLQHEVQDYGALFPLSLASEGSATLGGVLATNAGGTQVLRWGNARELCLGLEVVLADGTLLSDLDGLRKDHRGLNLRDLFIGSEGTLGVITAAVMKLVPAPRMRLAAWLTLASLCDVLHLFRSARYHLGESLSGFELMNASVQALLEPALPVRSAPWAVLLELSSGQEEERLRSQLEAWLAHELAMNPQRPRFLDAVIGQSEAQFAQLWALRESIPERQTRAGGNLKHDISLPLDVMEAFLAAVEPALQAVVPGLRPQVFGHAGDGNLHFNLAPPPGMGLPELRERHGEALTRCVFDHVALHGGSFSAEHGIGRLRREELARTLAPERLEWMRRVKALFDPDNRLNPGRVL